MSNREAIWNECRATFLALLCTRVEDGRTAKHVRRMSSLQRRILLGSYRCCDPQWFQCESRSESRDLMAKDWKFLQFLKEFFFFKNCTIFFPKPTLKDVKATGDHPVLKRIIGFWLFLCVSFFPSCIRNRTRITNAGPDPDPADKINFGPWESGSTTLVLIN